MDAEKKQTHVDAPVRATSPAVIDAPARTAQDALEAIRVDTVREKLATR